ncbi:hypothetical protein OAC51_09705 [Flavobacteriaceae bacterium]|nr:hypothetical protein [Flavobacteriaceae bacterium]
MKKKLQLAAFLFYGLCIFYSCENHAQKKTMTCETYNEKFIDYEMENQPDLALIYIDKAIECSSEKPEGKQFYKFSKVNFLIRQKEFERASKILNTFNLKEELALQIMDATLDMKIGRDSVDEKLRLSYDKINHSSSQKEIEVLIYKIALDNYFKGKEYALSEINKVKKVHTDYNSKLLISTVEASVKEKTKEDVFFRLFNFE